MSEDMKIVLPVDEDNSIEEGSTQMMPVGTEADAIASVDKAEDGVKSKAPARKGDNTKQDPAPKTKAGLLNAMYGKLSSMKKADLNAAYTKMSEEFDDMEVSDAVELPEFSVTDELNDLVESEQTLSDEFKAKTAVIFDTAIRSKLSEEIERIELYLSLEKMRFSEKFDYEIDLSSELDTESIEIPSMILQPFVENSIIHGVLSLEKKGHIKIRIFKQFDEVVFELTDNGIGIENSLRMKKSAPEGDHESKGVEITNRRIEILRKLTGENLHIIGPFQMNDSQGVTLGTKVILKLGHIENENE